MLYGFVDMCVCVCARLFNRKDQYMCLDLCYCQFDYSVISQCTLLSQFQNISKHNASFLNSRQEKNVNRESPERERELQDLFLD